MSDSDIMEYSFSNNIDGDIFDHILELGLSLEPLNYWAASKLRQPWFGPNWDTSGPGIPSISTQVPDQYSNCFGNPPNGIRYIPGQPNWHPGGNLAIVKIPAGSQIVYELSLEDSEILNIDSIHLYGRVVEGFNRSNLSRQHKVNHTFSESYCVNETCDCNHGRPPLGVESVPAEDRTIGIALSAGSQDGWLMLTKTRPNCCQDLAVADGPGQIPACLAGRWQMNEDDVINRMFWSNTIDYKGEVVLDIDRGGQFAKGLRVEGTSERRNYSSGEVKSVDTWTYGGVAKGCFVTENHLLAPDFVVLDGPVDNGFARLRSGWSEVSPSYTRKWHEMDVGTGRRPTSTPEPAVPNVEQLTPQQQEALEKAAVDLTKYPNLLKDPDWNIWPAFSADGRIRYSCEGDTLRIGRSTYRRKENLAVDPEFRE